MAIIRGLDELDKAQKSEKRESVSFDARLLLADGASARIRFCTDGREFIIADYHRVPTGRVSRAGRPIFQDVYCPYKEGEDCEPHTRVGKADAIPHRLMNAYVWVYSITKADGEETEINGVRLLRIGGGKNGYLSAMFTNFLRKYGTLCDRDYEWRRTGAGADDTVYSLLPEDKGPGPSNASNIIASLPSLEDVARGKVGFGNSRMENTPASTSDTHTEAQPVVSSGTTAPTPKLIQRERPVSSGKSLLERLKAEREKSGEKKEEEGDELF